MTLPQTFRCLALPFLGPIPRRGTPGVDLDGEWFSVTTETGLTAHTELPLLWHHDLDPLGLVKGKLGTATGWRRMEKGWVADVTLNDSAEARLVRELADDCELYVSSASSKLGKQVDDDGHIRRWAPIELSLSPSPKNPFALIFE